MTDNALDVRTTRRLARAAQAAQELSDALWEALREELADPRPERVAELSRRLVAVAGTVTTLASSDTEPDEQGVAAPAGATAAAQREFAPAPQRAFAPGERLAPATVLVDELAAQGDLDSYSFRARRRAAAVEDGL